MEEKHTFVAYAFRGSLKMSDIVRDLHAVPTKTDPHDAIYRSINKDSGVFAYAFGALAFWNIPAEERHKEIDALSKKWNIALSGQAEMDDYVVQECPEDKPRVEFNRLVIDQMTPERAEVIALTVAQSVTMEHYEDIMATMWQRINVHVESLKLRGNVTLFPAKFHKFIAETISMRNSIVGVLHLLDRPDLIWEDPVMDSLYSDLRATFDLPERFQAISYKLETTQDTLELLLDTTRDKRLFLVEMAIVLLILLEVILGMHDRGWLGT